LEVSGNVVVHKPIQEVFDLFADLEKSHEYSRPVIERTKLTEGPVGAGTRYSARDQWPGRQVEFTVEITEYKSPDLIAASWTSPMAGGWRAEFTEADSSGTRLDFHASMKPSGIMGLLSPILRPWASRQTRDFLGAFKSWAEQQ